MWSETGSLIFGALQVLEDNDPTGFKSAKGINAKKRCKIVPFAIPPRSPDLSVCDYALWAPINRSMRLQERKWPLSKRETRKEYIARLHKTAKALPKSFIDRAIGDMARRCERCYQAKGGHFEEGGRSKRPRVS